MIFEVCSVSTAICHVAGVDSDSRPPTDGYWVVFHDKGFQANIILWGMPRDISTLVVSED